MFLCLEQWSMILPNGITSVHYYDVIKVYQLRGIMYEYAIETCM